MPSIFLWNVLYVCQIGNIFKFEYNTCNGMVIIFSSHHLFQMLSENQNMAQIKHAAKNWEVSTRFDKTNQGKLIERS